MPRTGRVVIDGGTYHVLTRGNNGQVVFHHDADHQRYLQLLSTYAKEHELKIHHFAPPPPHPPHTLPLPPSPPPSPRNHPSTADSALGQFKEPPHKTLNRA